MSVGEVHLYTALAALLGLMVGSFLNVVIYRLPVMLERQWQREAREMLAGDGSSNGDGIPAHHYAAIAEEARFNLCTPASRCPHCGHKIAWYENIPVVSWLALRGKCHSCHGGISPRYPVIEIANALLWAWCIQRHGLTPAGSVWCLFSSLLLVAAMVDWDTTLLPDDLTLPLLWAGLLACAFDWTGVALRDALYGAVIGYLALWSIYWAFKLLTGKEGMGYGDFKLLAALGAWFGWQALIPVVLLSSLVGAVIGIALKLRAGLREGGYMPFGPFLAGAGFLVMFFGSGFLDRFLQP